MGRLSRAAPDGHVRLFWFSTDRVGHVYAGAVGRVETPWAGVDASRKTGVHPKRHFSLSGASGADEAMNSFRPSGKVRSLPLARCVPFLAW